MQRDQAASAPEIVARDPRSFFRLIGRLRAREIEAWDIYRPGRSLRFWTLISVGPDARGGSRRSHRIHPCDIIDDMNTAYRSGGAFLATLNRALSNLGWPDKNHITGLRASREKKSDFVSTENTEVIKF